jgi:hypothetical protein
MGWVTFWATFSETHPVALDVDGKTNKWQQRRHGTNKNTFE